MNLNLRTFKIEFNKPFKTAAAVYTSRPANILVGTAAGITAYGEASPLPGFSQETNEEVLAELKNFISNARVPDSFKNPGEIKSYLQSEKYLPTTPSGRFAVETLLIDLASKSKSISFSNFLNPEANKTIPVNATIGASSKANLSDYTDFKAIKLKANIQNPEKTALLASNIFNACGVKVRIDLNQSLELADFIKFAEKLPLEHIDFIEEPLKEPNSEKFTLIRERLGLRLAIDESLFGSQNYKETIELLKPDVLVIKPSMLGGVFKSFEAAECGRAAGAETAFTSIFESGIGILACLHTAAAVRYGVIPSGLNTLSFLRDPLISQDLSPNLGEISLADAPGLGAELQSFDSN